jgi:hypothetical protein
MLLNRIGFALLFSPDDAGGGSDDEEAIRDAGFQRLVDRYNNDAIGLARELFRENYQARRKNAELTTQLNEAKNRVPAEGSVVLTGEQAQQWAAYQAFGTPEQVKGIVEERGQLQGQLASAERERILRGAASVAGFDYDVLQNADALADHGGKKLVYEVREVEANGEKIKAAFVKDGDVEKPLEEYAKENWPKLMPALAVQQEGTGRSQGTFYPSQHQGSGGGNRPATAKQQTEATLDKQYASRAKPT